MSNDNNRTPTRREAMKGLGAGLATAPLVLAASAAEAQPQMQQGSGAARPQGSPRPAQRPPQAAVPGTAATVAGFGQRNMNPQT